MTRLVLIGHWAYWRKDGRDTEVEELRHTGLR
jgi:hypothetical protein